MSRLDLDEEDEAKNHQGGLREADQAECGKAAEERLTTGEFALVVLSVLVLAQVFTLGVGMHQHACQKGAYP